MAIMTNIPIMDIMTIVTITSNMTNCAYYTPSRDTKTPLTHVELVPQPPPQQPPPPRPPQPLHPRAVAEGRHMVRRLPGIMKAPDVLVFEPGHRRVHLCCPGLALVPGLQFPLLLPDYRLDFELRPSWHIF